MALTRSLSLLLLTACASTGPRPQLAVTSAEVQVPAGRFVIGSPEGEPGRDADEGPELEVSVPALRMDRSPVTAREFEARLAEVSAKDPQAQWWTEAATPPEWTGKCNLGSARGDHPMNCLNVRAARAYCRLLGKDLPTEAEWEYAARAGARTPFWWGAAFDGARAVSSVACGARGCAGSTSPVATAGPRCNAFGLCDMVGNVWQWTVTAFEERLGAYVSVIPEDAPANAVHRGGGWVNHIDSLFRSAHRGLNKPKHGLTGVGFRCVRR